MWMCFAYSITDSETLGAPIFLIRRMLRGGEGHWRERRSLVLLSGDWLVRIEIWEGGTCLDIWGLFCLAGFRHLGFLFALLCY